MGLFVRLQRETQINITGKILSSASKAFSLFNSSNFGNLWASSRVFVPRSSTLSHFSVHESNICYCSLIYFVNREVNKNALMRLKTKFTCTHFCILHFNVVIILNYAWNIIQSAILIRQNNIVLVFSFVDLKKCL